MASLERGWSRATDAGANLGYGIGAATVGTINFAQGDYKTAALLLGLTSYHFARLAYLGAQR